MSYDRLVVALDEDGWVAFRRVDKQPGDHSQAIFQLPKGFTLDDVLEAVRATGWVVDREGVPWIDHQTGCTFLADFVLEMFYYFDAPNRPSKRLAGIQAAVAQLLAGQTEAEVRLSPWVSAWLDLVVRNDAKEEVLTAEDLWRSDVLRVDIGKHRERRLRQALERAQQPAESSETAAGTVAAQGSAEAGRMAPSKRTRQPAEQRRREVG
jgi:hypothetical protein